MNLIDRLLSITGMKTPDDGYDPHLVETGRPPLPSSRPAPVSAALDFNAKSGERAASIAELQALDDEEAAINLLYNARNARIELGMTDPAGYGVQSDRSAIHSMLWHYIPQFADRSQVEIDGDEGYQGRDSSGNAVHFIDAYNRDVPIAARAMMAIYPWATATTMAMFLPSPDKTAIDVIQDKLALWRPVGAENTVAPEPVVEIAPPAAATPARSRTTAKSAGAASPALTEDPVTLTPSDIVLERREIMATNPMAAVQATLADAKRARVQIGLSHYDAAGLDSEHAAIHRVLWEHVPAMAMKAGLQIADTDAINTRAENPTDEAMSLEIAADMAVARKAVAHHYPTVNERLSALFISDAGGSTIDLLRSHVFETIAPSAQVEPAKAPNVVSFSQLRAQSEASGRHP